MTEITGWEENPTGAARVAWHSGSEGTYRLGYKGKVNLDDYQNYFAVNFVSTKANTNLLLSRTHDVLIVL